MIATSYVPVMAGGPEVIIWIVLAIGWVIIQAVVKNARKAGNASSRTDRSPQADLDNFLADLAGRVKEPSEPEPAPASAPPRLARPSAPAQMKASYAAGARTHVVVPRPQQRSDVPFEGPPVQTRAPSVQAQPRKAAPLVREPEPASMYVKEMILPAVSHDTGRKSARASALLESLTSPDDWRHAIVYREIMGPPKALRGVEMTTPGRGE